MNQLESMELAVKQEKEAIHSLKTKHSSIEAMLNKKVKKIRDKIKDFDTPERVGSNNGGKSITDDTLMRLKAKLIGKKIEREELLEKVNYLENQLAEEKETIKLAQKELIVAKEAEKHIENHDKDTNTSLEENRKELENLLDSIEQDLAKERSLLDGLTKTKITLEKMVSDNVQLLVNFTTEIND